jgi:hypothetical protein
LLEKSTVGRQKEGGSAYFLAGRRKSCKDGGALQDVLQFGFNSPPF